MRVAIPLMVNIPPALQITVRFSIRNPLCAMKLQVLPEGVVGVRLYEYRDDIVIEHVLADSATFADTYDIDPVAGPELWLDLMNTATEQRCVVATFTLEKGD